MNSALVGRARRSKAARSAAKASAIAVACAASYG